jgi:hypothetical protein
MKKKNEENRHTKSLEESLETLFGRETDLTDAELDEELNDCGIDPAELQASVHKQLFDYANHHYRTLDRDVPENLEKTLRALRPPSAADKAKAVVRTAENLIGKSAFGRREPSSRCQPFVRRSQRSRRVQGEARCRICEGDGKSRKAR